MFIFGILIIFLLTICYLYIGELEKKQKPDIEFDKKKFNDILDITSTDLEEIILDKILSYYGIKNLSLEKIVLLNIDESKKIILKDILKSLNEKRYGKIQIDRGYLLNLFYKLNI